MNSFDSLDLESQYNSTTDNQNNINYLENSFEENQNFNYKDDHNFETQLNKLNLTPNIINPEILESENDINIIQNPRNIPKNNITPKNLLFTPETHLELKTNSLLGRKRAGSGEVGKHTKFAQDNMIRKFKPYFKDSLKNFINSIIQKYIKFPENMFNGHKYKKMEILNINQEQVKDISVEMNIELLQKTNKDFFSVDISGNYSNYPKKFNKLLIEGLYNIENGERVTCILEKTYLESLKYFRMDEDALNNPKYSCLKGLEKSFLNFKEQLLEQNNEKYANDMIYLIKNFEKIYYNKRRRTRRIKKNL